MTASTESIEQRAASSAALDTPRTTSIGRLVDGFSRRGRELASRHIRWALPGASNPDALQRLKDLAQALQSTRGEASGVALSSDLIAAYRTAPVNDRLAFIRHLASAFDPAPVRVAQACNRYLAEGRPALAELALAVEAPRQELFRRLNFCSGGVHTLIAMRCDILDAPADMAKELAPVEADLVHLLQSWFNRGFLTMRRIDWSSPADLLEKLMRHEAVHEIADWDELRRRLEPPDRRCYAFFHPSLADEPLIFVEVALTTAIATSIQAILDQARRTIPTGEADTAIFYSISNCQRGLRGISFGHFLIKQVAIDLQREEPGLTRFATLSPIPGLRPHLRKAAPDLDRRIGTAASDTAAQEPLRDELLAAAVSYFLKAKNGMGAPLDPVARFHLGNGARLERINWRGDTSRKGHAQSGGLMVNYVYDLARLEEHHEDYAHRKAVVTGAPFKSLAARVAVH